MTRCMLTTVDNPHSPFDDFGAWYYWDLAAGYNSCSFLARILIDSDQLSEADQEYAIEKAIDEVVAENISGMWKKVVKEGEPEEIPQFEKIS